MSAERDEPVSTDKDEHKKRESSGDNKSGEGCTLHVRNLTRNVREAHLEEIFGYYGTVKSVKLEVDPKVKLSRGYAYVEFATPQEAEQAQLYMDGGQLDGNVIKVSFVLVSKRAARSSPEPREASPRGRRRSFDRSAPQRDTSDRPQSYRSDRPGAGRGRPQGRRSPPPRRSPIRRRSPSPRRRPSPPRRSRSPAGRRPMRRSRSPIRRRASPPRRRPSPPSRYRRRSRSSSYSSRSSYYSRSSSSRSRSRSYSSSSRSRSRSSDRSRSRDSRSQSNDRRNSK